MNFKIRAKKAIKRIAAISVGAAFLGATMSGALATTYAIGVSADSAAATKLATGAVTTDKITEDIGIGAGIANITQPENYFDNPLQDNDLAILMDTEISFNDGNGYDDYDVSDEIWFAGDSPSIETSLSKIAVDKEYKTDVAMEVAADSIFYYYLFDEAINISMVSEDYPIEMKFFGKDIKVTGVNWNPTTADADRLTVKVGETYYMTVGDEVSVDGHAIKLEDVGDEIIAVSVDGGEVVAIGIDNTHAWAEGLEVNADSIFYKSGAPETSTANVIIGESATKTYIDNDEFIGEDESNEYWRWDIIDLDSSTGTTTTITGAGNAANVGPILALKNYFVVADADDDDPVPVVNNGCYNIPVKDPYAQLCMDGLTVADEDYITLDIDFTAVDLRDAGGSYNALTRAPVTRIKAGESDSLRLDFSSLAGTAGYITSDVETDEIYLYNNYSLSGGYNFDAHLVEVFYIDQNNDVAIAGNMTVAANNTDFLAPFAYVDYQDTRDTDVQFWIGRGVAANLQEYYINITAIGTELPGGSTTRTYDNISISLQNSTGWAGTGVVGTGEWDQLGATQNAELAGDLMYAGAILQAAIGTQDEDLRTQYGIIIKDPDTHCANDNVNLLIPGDAVRAKVTIGAYGATGAAIVDEAATPDEVASVTEGSILVGGPAANKYTADAMGVTFPTYGTDLGWSTGHCYIKDLTLSGKSVTVVAGYSAADTDACVDEYISGTRSNDGVLA